MRYLIETKTADFKLHPLCQPGNYQISDTLRDVNRWKSKILAGNSMTDGRKMGDWDEVGYVMISRFDNTLIPIARCDEHNMGGDLLHEMFRKSDIDPKSFTPMCDSGNFVYSQKDVEPLLIAGEKWLAYGGPDVLVRGSYDMSGLMMSLTNFVASKGQLVVRPDHLNPLGEEIYQGFVRTAEALREARDDEFNRRKAQAAFLAARDLLRFLLRMRFGLPIKRYADLDIAMQTLAAKQRENDIRGLEELMFGFHGVKNMLHNELREVLKAGDGYSFNREKAEAVFGNIALAVDMLGRF